MNSRVHPLIALLVIVLSLLTIGVWVWGSGQAKTFGGPAELATDPAGHWYLQIQNILLEHDADGNFIRRHDLSALGVEQVLGTVSFFSNGDVLLRRGIDSRTLFDKIRAYIRLPNEKPLRPDLAGTGLYRCNLQTAACTPFGPELTDFAAAFGLYIDPRTDEVYISDTSRHILRKYSAQGDNLGQATEGLKFPNQLLIHDNRLYVADTNHHRIRVVEPRTDSFGTEIDSIDVVPTLASRSGQIWPSHLARVGDDWWVNNMSSRMDDGGVYVFDQNWAFKFKLDLPRGADPIAIKAFGDDVLITDWNNDLVYRVTSDGQRMPDFQSSGLEKVIAESVSLRWQYQTYAYLAVVAFVLLLIALVIKGITNTSSEPPAENTKKSEALNDTSDEIIWVEPDARIVRKLRMTTYIAGLCIVGLIPVLAYIIIAAENSRALLDIVPPMAGIVIVFLLVTRVNRTNVRTAIRLHGRNITLRDYTGHETTVPIRKVIFNQVAIATPDVAVFLGQPLQMPVYNRAVLESQVFPRLTDARSVSAWEMQWAMIRMRHPQGIFTLLISATILLAGIWMLLRDSV